MPGLQTLFDTLSGAAGAPVNREGLNNFVATSQAMNGLRSAQTDEAMLKAQQARDQAFQDQSLEDKLKTALGPGNEALASLGATLIRGGHGDGSNAMDALLRGQQLTNRGTLGDSSKLGSPEQTAAMQGVEGKIAPLINAPDQYAVAPGAPAPTVLQTPQGAAKTAEAQANAALHNAMATDPASFHPSSLAKVGLDPDSPTGQALALAVKEGRIDYTRINSRTAPVLGQLALANPGFNFNKSSAAANLQRNPLFQQKAMSVEMLPGILTHMTTLGKALGYNDVKLVGRMDQWFQGQDNDPKLTEFMTVRNDALLRLAGVMRGVGMSDQAHRAEQEANQPTLAPYALDAWLKGQMSVVQPMLDRQREITGHGDTPASLAAEAAAKGGPPVTPPVVPAATGEPPKISTDDEYAALPSGTSFIDPHGVRRKKP